MYTNVAEFYTPEAIAKVSGGRTIDVHYDAVHKKKEESWKVHEVLRI